MMPNVKDKKSYTVGYKRPPKHSQFRPGQSGNPKGRPKRKQPKSNEILDTVINQKIRVTLDGKAQAVSALEALFRQIVANALKGDKTAAKLFLSLLDQHGYFDKGPPEGSYGVMRVPYPMNDEKEWSRRTQKNQRIAQERDRNFNVDEFIAAQKATESNSQKAAPPNKPKRVRVRLAKKKT